MEFQIRPLEHNIQHVVLEGAFDIRGAAAVDLPFATLAGAQDRVLVDLSRVTFLASIGIRTLLTSARTVARRGGQFVLAAPQPMVRESLETSGIAELIPVVPDLAAAIAILQTSG